MNFSILKNKTGLGSTCHNFIGYVQGYCDASEFKLELIDNSSVTVPNTDIKCSGFFDPKLKLLRVATDRPEDIWLGVLAHEFNHLIQYKTQHSYFKNEIYPDELFDRWVDGEEIKNINSIIDQIRDIEYDCEYRTINTILQFNLPIDIDEYVRMANAYILAHNLMKTKRKFISKQVSILKDDKRLPNTLVGDLSIKKYNDILESLFD